MPLRGRRERRWDAKSDEFDPIGSIRRRPIPTIGGGGEFRPLFPGGQFASRLQEYEEGAAKWAEGLKSDWNGGWVPRDSDDDMAWDEWHGSRPDPDDYMPTWTEEEATHLMMYENTTEGTPISPAFATPEELARWLADNGASSFASTTASYEAWLRVCRGGYAPSMVSIGGVVSSGVEGLTKP